MRIRPLSSHVANQIAAGEVIERPASVVKELLENALDAGATALSIDIGFGGLNLIKVTDNGQGIAAEDLPLAIAAHATSKITQLADLYAIHSMGFRGEALASIAAVSRMKLYSKPAEQAHGMLLQVDETGIRTEPYARTQGTTVEVCDLFFNTPVRKTFLKSDRLEYQAIEIVVKQFALSAPEMTITLQHNQKKMLHLIRANCESSRARRVKKIFGHLFLHDALYIQEASPDFTMVGWISQKSYQRSQRDRQWVYLNQRLIKDKLIFQAIGQAYQDLLHPGRYPSCILYLNIPPDQVDVNVHPTKHEVRFRDSRLIHAKIVSGLASHLHKQETLSSPRSLHTPDLLKTMHLSASSPIPATRHDGGEAIWLILNQNFAILRLDDGSYYLADMTKIHRQYVTHTLHILEKPCPHRLLLVPVRIDITPSTYPYLEQHRANLLKFGLQFDFISTHQMILRTMPVHVPWLDLQGFFKAMQHPSSHQDYVLQQMIACQKFDAYNMSAMERDALRDYCLKNWDTMHTIQACLSLDIPTCQHMMRQTYSFSAEL